MQTIRELIERCWKGYEPVPGKAPYSNDSCRKKQGKKSKKKKKSSGFNKPSSNFSSKKKKSFNVSRFGN